MTAPSVAAEALDVLLLLDDTTELAGRSDGCETYLFVSEVVEALEAALERLGHRSRRASFAMGVAPLIAHLDSQPPDVVFHLGQPTPTDPASEAQVTAVLDLLRIPHTSESSETLTLARDKARAKALFAQAGIPTPRYAVSQRGELPDALPCAPWIAKPTLQDGSVGIPCAPATRGRAELAERVRALYQRFGESVLVGVVSAFNEWDPLEEVIVGRVEGARVPRPDPGLHALEFAHLQEMNEIPSGPFCRRAIEETAEDLDILADELTKLGVLVRRPCPIDHARAYRTPDWESDGLFNYCPRDSLLVIGDVVIETPMVLRSRQFENLAYRQLLTDYQSRGALDQCAATSTTGWCVSVVRRLPHRD